MRVQSKAISFKGQNIFVGIDVHLKTWAVTVLTESGGYKSAFTQPASKSGKTKCGDLQKPNVIEITKTKCIK